MHVHACIGSKEVHPETLGDSHSTHIYDSFQQDDPLTAPQVRRGAFQNSGTKDIGKDPNWDFRTGTYKKPSGYQAIADEEKATRLSPEFQGMADETYKKHQQEIEDFAKKGINRKRDQKSF